MKAFLCNLCVVGSRVNCSGHEDASLKAGTAGSRVHWEPQLLLLTSFATFLMEVTLPRRCSWQWGRMAGIQRQACSWVGLLWQQFWLLRASPNFPLNFSQWSFHPALLPSFPSLLHLALDLHHDWWPSQPPLGPSPFSLLACFSQDPG